MSTLCIERVLASPEFLPFVPSLDAWLRPDEQWSLADEFPQVFGPGATARHHMLMDGDRLLAHAAILDQESRCAGQSFFTSLVGSVVVAPFERGQGLGRIVMESVLRDFEASESHALLLWSDKLDFYRHLGLHPIGEEEIIELLPEAVPEDYELRAATEDDLPALLALHEQKPCYCPRELLDFALLLRIPETECMVLVHDGQIQAYAVAGKGLDFRGYVHECGGSEEDIGILVRGLAQGSATPLGFFVAPWRRGHAMAWARGTAVHSEFAIGKVRASLPSSFYLEGLDSI